MKKIVLFAAAALALAACDKNDDNIILSPEAAQISATIGESVTTRAKDQAWNQDDAIGITSTVGGAVRPYVNVKYTTDGTTEFTGETRIYFYNKMALTAYYPFTGTEGKVPGVEGIIAADTRAANQTSDKQPDIDFLYASSDQVKVNTPEISFGFTHQMAKLTFKFQNNNAAADVSKITSYELSGLVMTGTFDTSTGTAKADEAPSETLSMTVDDITAEGAVAPLIIFPQNPGHNTVNLRIHSNELDDVAAMQYYTCTLNFGDDGLQAEHNYVYTINVSKTGLSIEKPSITNWTDTSLTSDGQSE